MQTNQPWDHPSFWPYIARCILRGFHLPASSFMRTLTDHPHAPISKLAAILHHHLSVYPRSHQTSQFPLESQFVSAHRSWLSRLRAEVSTFLGGRPKGSWLEEKSGGGKDWKRWEDGFRVVIDLMEGKAEAVLEQAADWREAVGAWGVLVDVQLKRDDLPYAFSLFAMECANTTVLLSLELLRNCRSTHLYLTTQSSQICVKAISFRSAQLSFSIVGSSRLISIGNDWVSGARYLASGAFGRCV
jgi:hypothetical protein